MRILILILLFLISIKVIAMEKQGWGMPDLSKYKQNEPKRKFNRPQLDYLYTQREDVGKAFNRKKDERKKAARWWEREGSKRVRPGGLNFDYQYGKYREKIESDRKNQKDNRKNQLKALNTKLEKL